MYNHYFGFTETPFSIAPDPRYLYLSEQHREALAHLLYGVGDQGGFVVLTGEVGTGKTTVCRCLLQQVPDHVDVAVVVNPKLSTEELLLTVCEELGVPYDDDYAGNKGLIDALNHFLLRTHARGRNAILIIDEAQNLAPEVLEQLRLLTNLETNERKLLQLILLGQPELNELLARPEMRQLAQRITARYHLRPLTAAEVERYVAHRLAVAGGRGELFSAAALRLLARFSQGIPRLINVLCDRALLGAYATGVALVDDRLVRQAAREVLPNRRRLFAGLWGHGAPATAGAPWRTRAAWFGGISLALVLAVVIAVTQRDGGAPTAAKDSAQPARAEASWVQSLAQANATERAALAHLYQLWNIEPPSPPDCRPVAAPLGCAVLEHVDRPALERGAVPAVLALHSRSWDAPRYVVLTELDGDSARIYFEQRAWQVPWRQLARFWRGEARLLVPASLAELPLRGGETSALVEWVDAQLWRHYQGEAPRWERREDDYSERLSRDAGKAAWLASHYLTLRPEPPAAEYGPALQDMVRRFQAEQGLTADGIVEVMTLLTLARGLPGPSLLSAVDLERPAAAVSAGPPRES